MVANQTVRQDSGVDINLKSFYYFPKEIFLTAFLSLVEICTCRCGHSCEVRLQIPAREFRVLMLGSIVEHFSVQAGRYKDIYKSLIEL